MWLFTKKHQRLALTHIKIKGPTIRNSVKTPCPCVPPHPGNHLPSLLLSLLFVGRTGQAQKHVSVLLSLLTTRTLAATQYLSACKFADGNLGGGRRRGGVVLRLPLSQMLPTRWLFPWCQDPDFSLVSVTIWTLWISQRVPSLNLLEDPRCLWPRAKEATRDIEVGAYWTVISYLSNVVNCRSQETWICALKWSAITKLLWSCLKDSLAKILQFLNYHLPL